MLTLFCFIIGGGLTAFFTLYFNLVESIADIWKPILILLGSSIGVFVALFAILWIVSLFINTKKPVKKPSKICLFIYTIFSSFLCFWGGINLKVTGKEKLGKAPYLFVFNHRSNFDPLVISVVFRKQNIMMISKPQNFKIPMGGPIVHKAGFLAIDRENDREALKTIIKGIDYLKSGELSVGVCPEGTRNKNDINLLPFKPGAFKMATKSNAPIAVVCLNGTEKVKKRFPFLRTNVYVDVLGVITQEEYKDMNTQQISDKVSAMMQETIDKYNK